jgi:hypothetical protein
MQLSEVTPAILESQLKGLKHERTRAGAVATLLILLPRMEEADAPMLEPYIGALTELLEGGGGDGGAEAAGMQVRVNSCWGSGGVLGAWRQLQHCAAVHPSMIRQRSYIVASRRRNPFQPFAGQRGGGAGGGGVDDGRAARGGGRGGGESCSFGCCR